MRLIAAVVLAMFGPPAFAQETITNPEFANWSKFKKGTSITLQTLSTDNSGDKTFSIPTTTTTIKLLEVGDDKLVLETTVAHRVKTIETTMPSEKRDVLKTIKVPKVDVGVETPRPVGVVGHGLETINVDSTDIKTKWTTSATKADGTTTTVKRWESDDVPGLLVKMEIISRGKVLTVALTNLIEIKKP